MRLIHKTRRFLSIYKGEILAVAVVVVLAGGLRLTGLGQFLTADEKNWIGRSYEFIRAFKDWRFNDMLQTTHPGVTTLWLAGILVAVRMVVGHIPFNFNNLAQFVEYAQLPIVVVNGLFLPIFYLLIRKLFNKPLVAWLGTVLIALNPIIIGYSRLVHVDALLMNFMLASALSMIIYAREDFSWGWLLGSAVWGGLAVLTKAPAVFLLPYFVLVILFFQPKFLVRKDLFVARGRDLVMWIMVAGLLFVLLWPAILWVQNPEGNVLLLKRDIGRAVVTPHHMTESYKVDAWFYLFTLITRTTPAVQVFSIVFIGWLVMVTAGKYWSRLEEYSCLGGEAREYVFNGGLKLLRVMWLIVLYGFFFGVMMTLGAKKGDRYILPVFPVIDLMAAGGMVVVSSCLINWLRRTIRRVRLVKAVVYIVVVGGVVGWLLSTDFYYHPYAIAYSNPWWPDNLSEELGWGEGLEQVADWLNGNDPEAVVASWYPEELGAFTSAQVAHINAHEQGKVRYIVLYKNMFGRAPDHPANDFIDEYYKKRVPVFVAYVAGKEFAWVYEKPVYERVVGELLPGEKIGQEIQLAGKNLAGLEVMVATYSGQAQSGVLAVTMRDKRDGRVVYRWEKRVSEIEDDLWLRLLLPDLHVEEDGSVFIEIEASGTSQGNAPTIRYARDFDYRSSEMVWWRQANNYQGLEVDGDLAVRMLYSVDGQVVTDDDTRLLNPS